MNAIRLQIHLKYIIDENSSSKTCYNFWYAFEPSKMLTINDIIEDIRINYLKDQLSLSMNEKDDENKFIIHLDDCELLPFTSSGILRDNDQITFMPLQKYKLNNKLLQDTINMDLSSSITIETPSVPRFPTLSENNSKKQCIEPIETTTPSEPTITTAKPVRNIDEESSQKTKKSKLNEDQVVISSITKSTSESPTVHTASQTSHSIVSVGQSTTTVVQPAVSVVQLPSTIPKETIPVMKESITEKDIYTDQPKSCPSSHVFVRELKSKTPTWKSLTPPARSNTKDKIHIRFDSESDEEPLPEMKTTNTENTVTKALPSVNDIGNSTPIQYHSSTTTTPKTTSTSNETKNMKKTIDLLFEMKQHKAPNERQEKKLKQQFAKNRAQHRKRALEYFSMANFVDQAFGIEKNELEKLISPNEYQTSSSTTPQTLPTSFNKLARLPLVAEAIDDNDKIYDLYPPVTECPSIQTRIAFKLLELGEDFCPKMSSYNEGTVLDVDQTSSKLTIKLDKPYQTVFDQPSKFYAPSEEEEEEKEKEDLTTVVLSFSDLNEARLLPMSNGHT